MIAVRSEGPDDVGAIRDVHRRAFGGDLEGQIVDALRANGALLLSLVATIEARVVGHIAYSPATVGSVRGAALGPMGVLPEWQRRGTGSALISEGNRRIANREFPFIVVVGHAGYYPRFGFVPAVECGLTSEWEVPPEVFMALILDPGKMRGVSGLARYRREFSAAT